MAWRANSLGKCNLAQKFTLWFPLSFYGNAKASEYMWSIYSDLIIPCLSRRTSGVKGSIINNPTRATGIKQVTLVLDQVIRTSKLSGCVRKQLSSLSLSRRSPIIPKAGPCDCWHPSNSFLQKFPFIVSKYGFKKILLCSKNSSNISLVVYLGASKRGLKLEINSHEV